MKKIITVLLCIASALWVHAQRNSTAHFSLLTCSPSVEVYSTFGHTALRYQNPRTGSDIVFNYGLFSFDDTFLFNFVKGETLYELGVQEFDYFMEHYAYTGRGVVEQHLNFTPQEVEALYEFLRINYLPENRAYLYNFFYDNCSSRVRDIFASMFGHELQWKLPPLVQTDTLWIRAMHQHLVHTAQPTFRSLVQVYTTRNSWLDCGIALALGVPADRPATEFETMFLPDCLFLFSENARILPTATGGETRKLVSATEVLLPTEEIPKPSLFLSPNVILWILALVFVFISFVEFRTRRHFYWIDSLLYFVLGVVGILVCFLSFFSIHPAVFPNINIVWVQPLHIIFAILWLVPSLRKYLRYYAQFYLYVFIAMLIVYFLPVQYIPFSFTAVFVIMLSRSVGMVWGKY
ncbi:MAG: DUF4105 domain-containing protein [Bacteroidales bacterium]|jgi:hypothetical protein|nr:DUF4105 domain-containing protein [Bacteroidales bacterium]